MGVARTHVIGIMEKNRHTGFTLVELMIALVIAGILIQVVAPGFQKMIKDGRIRAEVYAIRAALNTARSEALTQRQNVVVCPGTAATGCGTATADWTDGFIAFVDTNRDNAYTPPTNVDGDNIIVAHSEDSPDSIKIWLASTAGDAFIRFTAQGYTGTTASLEVCDDRELTDARGLTISAIGYISAAEDTDGDEIRNDHGGNNFDCVAPT